MNKTQTRLSKIFSGYVATIPILQYYISPVGSLNLATAISFVFLLFFTISILRRGRIGFESLVKPMRFYVLFIVANLIITSFVFNYSYTWNNVGTTVRLFFLYIGLIAIGNRWFDHEISFYIMEKILMVSAFFVIIHTILYSTAHVRVTPIIESLVTKDSLNLDLNRVRTGGLYMEPAHYAQSAILYLCYKLFPNTKEKPVLDKKSLFVIVGLVFSGSGQGYAMLAVVYCIWVFYTMFIEKANIKRFFIAGGSVALVLLLFVALLQISYVRNAITRIVAMDSGSIAFGGQALAGRTYTNHYFHEFSDLMKLTGVGFGHVAEITRGGFTNSLYAHLIQCGYPSLFFLVNIFAFYFKKGPASVKVHTILYAIMITFTAMANAMMLCFFTQFYISMCKNQEETPSFLA